MILEYNQRELEEQEEEEENYSDGELIFDPRDLEGDDDEDEDSEVEE